MANNEKAMRESLRPMYARHWLLGPSPRHAIPAGGMPPATAYQLIHDELILDGSSRFNLATFCGTWMEPEAINLMSETFDKNMIDKDEHPQTAELEMRCVHMLADLWHSPDPATTIGASTIGSSEACMLGGLALKWRWRERMRKLGKPTDRPNLVLGTNTQVCWHKFLRYWDVEERAVPLEGDHYITDAERAAAACDENTIGVVSVLGSTFTGEYEDVAALSAALDRLQERTGLDIPIHVDGASGAFVAPFIQSGLVWDFELPRVKSINTSGHKIRIGLPRRGLDRMARSRRPASRSDLQRGLPRRQHAHVSHQLLAARQPDCGTVLQSDPARQVGIPLHSSGLPGRGREPRPSDRRHGTVRAAQHWPRSARVRLEAQATGPLVAMHDLADRLRDRGWQVPAYRMPANRQEVVVQRVVVRNGFTHDLAGMLLRDIQRHLDWFASQPGLKATVDGAGFHH